MTESIAALLLRIGVGLTFFLSGLEKTLGGLDRVVDFFRRVGIPWPEIMAPFVAYLELIGGLALLIGLFTVPLGLLFVAEMVVAILVVRMSDVIQAGSVAPGFAAVRLEVMLFLASACLVLLGSGRWSADAALGTGWQWRSSRPR